MKTQVLFISFILSITTFSAFCVDMPQDPSQPYVSSSSNDVKSNTNDKKIISISYTRENGLKTEGTTTNLSNFYITGLTWSGNEDGIQSIQIDYVKSITIKGYTMQKTTRDNLSAVFYIPYVYDIVLTNGKIILDAIGKIKQIETFNTQTANGNEKCYTYFIRYWLEDKGEFANNGSKNYNEKPIVPDSVVTKIEFTDNIK